MKRNFQKAFFLIFLILISSFAFAGGTFKIDVATNGGSGRAYVVSPAEISVSGGNASVKIVWSSANYDYMIFGGKKYLNENLGGKSSFTLPLSAVQVKNLELGNADKILFTLKVAANTTAMGRPHEIEYELIFGKAASKKNVPSALNNAASVDIQGSGDFFSEKFEGGAQRAEKNTRQTLSFSSADFSSLKKSGSLNLSYAKEFSVDFYETQEKFRQAQLPSISSKLALIRISGGGSFMLVPPNEKIPHNVPPETTILRLPLDKTYLVSSSAMDYVAKLGAAESVRFSGTKESGWHIQEAKDAMKSKKLLYAGKYSAPDYELLLSLGCNFALENTMIYHNPEVKEKLEELGIPVLVERSGYEEEPLGRLEWIKLYGVLFGKESEAQDYFDSEIKKIKTVLSLNQKNAGNRKNQKSAAFFFVNSNGAVNVRSGGDYISKMIEIAGGNYVPQDNQKSDEKKHISSQTIQFESFYALSRGADILIYDGTIGGEISRKSDLIKKNPLFADFKAYKSGKIYCVGRDFFQRSTGTADFISDVSKVIAGEEDALVFLRKVK